MIEYREVKDGVKKRETREVVAEPVILSCVGQMLKGEILFYYRRTELVKYKRTNELKFNFLIILKIFPHALRKS